MVLAVTARFICVKLELDSMFTQAQTDLINKMIADAVNAANLGGGFNQTPYHLHNQTDSPQLPPSSTKGFVPLPSIPNHGTTPATTNAVFSAINLTDETVNNPTSQSQTPAQSYVYPMPLIFGGISTTFSGGVAPTGVYLGSITSSGYEFWIRFDDSWHGVNLPLSV